MFICTYSIIYYCNTPYIYYTEFQVIQEVLYAGMIDFKGFVPLCITVYIFLYCIYMHQYRKICLSQESLFFVKT